MTFNVVSSAFLNFDSYKLKMYIKYEMKYDINISFRRKYILLQLLMDCQYIQYFVLLKEHHRYFGINIKDIGTD